MNKKELNIIVSGWEYGAGKSGTSKGPDALLQELQTRMELPCEVSRIEQIVDAEDVETIRFPHLKRAAHLIEHQSRLAELIESQTSKPFTLLLSGDHSNAIGGMAGFCRNRNPREIGIVWIDAHLDLHSPYTTPSGNIHGMSVNTALEIDNIACQVNTLSTDCIALWEQIKNLKKTDAVPAENVVFMGIRSYEDPEIRLVKDAGIKVIFAEEIHKNGIQWALEQVRSHLESRCKEWYVSFDVDSMDPTVSKGTGTPVTGGLSKAQAQTCLEFFWSQDPTRCLEITEINPELDLESPMALQVADILAPLLS